MNKSVLLFIISCSALVTLFTFKHSNVTHGDLLSYQNTANNFHAYISGQTPRIDTVYPALATNYFFFIKENPFGLPFHIMWTIALLYFGCATILIALYFFEGRHVRWLFPSILFAALLLGGGSLFEGFDVIIMLLIFLMIASFEAKSFVWTGFFLTVAIALKTSPVFLIPLIYVACSGHRKNIMIGMIAGTIFCITIVTITGGLGAFYNATVSNLRAMRLYGIDVMSSLSAFDMLIHGMMGMKIPIGKIPSDPLPSWNTNFPHMTKTLLLIIIASACTVLPWLKKTADLRNNRYFFAASCAILLLVLTLSPVFTPHYLFWVLPLVIMWLCEEYESGRYTWKQLLPITLAMVMTGLTTQWIFPTHWVLLQNSQPLHATIIHNIRTVSLIILTTLLWRSHHVLCTSDSIIRKNNVTT